MSHDPAPRLEQRLLEFLDSIVPPASPAITGSTEIFTTGLFDSLALVQLVVWVEGEIGRPLDPSTFQMRSEWARVTDIVRFVVRETTP